MKTPDPSILGEAGIQDHLASFRALAPLADWVTLNVSCPNTSEGKTFESIDELTLLISEIQKLKEEMRLIIPILVKLSPLSDPEAVSRLIAVLVDLGVDGVILANTHSGRDLPLAENPAEIAKLGKGGISGQPIFEKNQKMTSLVAAVSQGRLTIIACGGVATAEQAYDLINRGASLVQIYTSMVFSGPGIFTDINRGLQRLLALDGFRNISEAIGRNNS